MDFPIGINLGDVVVKDNVIYGDGSTLRRGDWTLE